MTNVLISEQTYELFTRALAARWAHNGGTPTTQEEAVREWALRELGRFGITVPVSPELVEALKTAEEAEFTELPVVRTWDEVKTNRLQIQEAPVTDSTVYHTWPEGYTLFPGKAFSQGGDRDLSQPFMDSAGTYHYPLGWSAEKKQAWYDENHTEPTGGLPSWAGDARLASQTQGVGQTVPHMTPEEEAVTFGGAGVPFEPVTPPEETLLSGEETRVKRRRTKVEMDQARAHVASAYRKAAGDTPWSKGWELAHDAGRAAADIAAVEVHLTPYQVSQTIAGVADDVRVEFDAPIKPTDPDSRHTFTAKNSDGVEIVITDYAAATPNLLEYGPTESAVWVEVGTTPRGPIIPGQTYNEDTVPDPPAEVAATHGLPEPEGDPAPTLEEVVNMGDMFSIPPEPTAPSDDDIFKQFLSE